MADWRQLTAVLWIGISAAFLLLVWQARGSADIASFTYPLVCAVLVIILGLYCLWRKQDEVELVAFRGLMPPVLVFGAMGAFWLFLPLLGFLPASGLLVAALGTACTPRERRLVVLLVGLALSLAIWVLFQFVLDASLPAGSLFER